MASATELGQDLAKNPCTSSATTSEGVCPTEAVTHSPVIYAITKEPVQRTVARRRQVKIACVNCQKACKKCDESRPCQRCVQYELEHRCVDAVRKERQRGAKSGSHSAQNKRKGAKGRGQKGKASNSRQEQSQTPVNGPQFVPIAKPPFPQFYGQHFIVPGMPLKPGEPVFYSPVPPFYLAALPSGSSQAAETGFVAPPFPPFPMPAYAHPSLMQYASSYPQPYTRPRDTSEAGPDMNVLIPAGRHNERTGFAALNAAFTAPFQR